MTKQVNRGYPSQRIGSGEKGPTSGDAGAGTHEGGEAAYTLKGGRRGWQTGGKLVNRENNQGVKHSSMGEYRNA